MKRSIEPIADPPVGVQSGPAWLDLGVSLTGLALALFMWVHLTLVSSVHFGKETMNSIAGFFELKFLNAQGYPAIVVALGIIIFGIFVTHAGLAMRKFPASYRQYRLFNHQMGMMKHADTNLWFVQALTGFIMFFFGAIHLYIMISQAAHINADAAGERFVTGNLWPMYLILHLSVGLHLVVGLYRLAVKWGPFDGKNPRRTRRVLKNVRNALAVFYLAVGLLTIFEYMKIGYENRSHGSKTPPAAARAGEDPGSAEGGSAK